MKFVICAALATALMAISGCTIDDYDGCRGRTCLVDRSHKGSRKIDDRPQFDRNGNPNFDTRGRYIGCHGLGCKVDDPDDGDQSIDDRPQYDKEGNPNFDTQGNYQGCRGIGCEVDTPDDDNSSDDDDSD
ncbi:hypothetical protein NKI95_08790 [Mesorhizobium sp. M0306]|uniref:hypothetical protein n=1 Tax=Mesorhizobium sp. M0306 TaxID=2956932 RepID=UPI003335FD13